MTFLTVFAAMNVNLCKHFNKVRLVMGEAYNEMYINPILNCTFVVV